MSLRLHDGFRDNGSRDLDAETRNELTVQQWETDWGVNLQARKNHHYRSCHLEPRRSLGGSTPCFSGGVKTARRGQGCRLRDVVTATVSRSALTSGPGEAAG